MRGLLRIGRLLGGGFRGIIGVLSTYKRILPIGFAGLIVTIKFIRTLLNEGVTTATKELALTVLAAEQSLRANVDLAISAAPTYNFLVFLEIITSVIIIYFVIKYAGILGTGDKTHLYKWISGVVIFIILELSALAVIGGQGFTFIPLWDGVIYLIKNLGAVWNNINWLDWTTAENQAQLLSGNNSSTNASSGS